MDAFPQSLPDFLARFGTDTQCRDYLTALRWPDGVDCHECGRVVTRYDATRRLWRCGCGTDTSVTAGTALHRSKIPLQTWFFGAWLTTTLKPGISALQFQGQLGLSRYETAWTMLHKLRSAMVAPDRSLLTGMVQVDEFWIGGREEGVKSRASTGKVDAVREYSLKRLVIVAVEVRFAERINKKTGETTEVRYAGRARMKVIDTTDARSVIGFIRENVAVGSHINTDGLKSYNRLGTLGFEHEVTIAKETDDPLPMVGLIQTNFRRWWIGTHKGAIHGKHLQTYCNEFVFRFNRRNDVWWAFRRALGLAVLEREAPTYHGLYAGEWKHRNHSAPVEYSIVEVLEND